MIFGRGRISEGASCGNSEVRGEGVGGDEEKTPRPSPRPPTSTSGTSHQRSLSAPNTFPYSTRSSRLPLSNFLPSLSTNILPHHSRTSSLTAVETEVESIISPLSTVSPSSAVESTIDLSSPASPSSLSSILRPRPPPSSSSSFQPTSSVSPANSSSSASSSLSPSITTSSSGAKPKTENVDVHLDLLMHYPSLASGTGHVLSIVAFAIFLSVLLR